MVQDFSHQQYFKCYAIFWMLLDSLESYPFFAEKSASSLQILDLRIQVCGLWRLVFQTKNIKKHCKHKTSNHFCCECCISAYLHILYFGFTKQEHFAKALERTQQNPKPTDKGGSSGFVTNIWIMSHQVWFWEWMVGTETRQVKSTQEMHRK